MRIIAILVVVLGFACPAWAGDAGVDATFRAGLSAFNEGRYGRAFALWNPLADGGDARAQEGIGFMYYSGRGVAHDSHRAAAYFYRAANQGEPTAQLFLAYMHFKSDGVPKSAPLAMMWAELAVDGGQPEAYELLGEIRQSMTDAERAEEIRLLIRWREIYANARARK